MKVWINQELCTGDGQCIEICPDVFFMHDDGTNYRSYVKPVGASGCGPTGRPTLTMGAGMSDVPPSLEEAVREAADFCPGACIFVVSSRDRDIEPHP